MENEHFGEALATGHDPTRPRRNRKIHITDPDPKRDGNRFGRTDELRTKTTSSGTNSSGLDWAAVDVVVALPDAPETHVSVDVPIWKFVGVILDTAFRGAHSDVDWPALPTGNASLW